LSASHYPITHIKISNSYVFVTARGQTYTVYFDLHTGILPEESLDEYAVYMGFSCEPVKEMFDRKFDPRIGDTIMLIIANLFKAYPRTILTYVCSPADGQARQRSIAFGKWFNDSPLRDKLCHLKNDFAGTYCGTLYSKKHPLAEEIENAFLGFNPENKFEPGVQEELTPYLLYDEEE